MNFVNFQIVYLLYGSNKSYLHELMFSVLSLFVHTERSQIPRILVYTDQPQRFHGWPVDVVELSNEMLVNWEGEDGYLHRRKACAIDDSLQYANYSIFVDTDTFFIDSASKLLDLLKQNEWVVDEIEGFWGGWRSGLLYLKTSKILSDKYRVKDDLILVNSGVFGVKENASEFMKKSIELIDELYPVAKPIHMVEQFCLSIAGYHSGKPAEAKKIVRHYWAEKRYWRMMLGYFFSMHGERFSEDLLKACKVAPRKRPKPSVLKKMIFRISSIGLDSKSKKMLRFLFYAANLSGGGFKESCSMAYLHHFIESSNRENMDISLNCVVRLRPFLFSRSDVYRLRKNYQFLIDSMSPLNN